MNRVLASAPPSANGFLANGGSRVGVTSAGPSASRLRMQRPLLSVVTPAFNEEGNVTTVYERVKRVFDALPEYDYEHIFIDNASRDGTAAELRSLAAKDPRVKVIFNVRNFGHIRSPYHAMLQTKGEAVISVVADLQDPPEMIPQFIEKWKAGYKVVMAVKKTSEESAAMFAARKSYYEFVALVSDVKLVRNSTGFGLYDRVVIEELKKLDDPYPYFRGLVAELGWEPALIPYDQPTRKRGITKNNFLSLYDMAMLGIVSHSKIPLRLATLLGFLASFLSFLLAVGYLIIKLVFWNEFSLGLAPIAIGLFFFSSVQLFFIGIIGEYLGFAYTQIVKRPLVVEKERINF